MATTPETPEAPKTPETPVTASSLEENFAALVKLLAEHGIYFKG